jgi:hypothetical protein
MYKTRKIEINFPVPVELPPGFEQALDGLIHLVTERYRCDFPNRTMWPAGHGCKPNPGYTSFEQDIYVVDVVEREKTHKERKRDTRRATNL